MAVPWQVGDSSPRTPPDNAERRSHGPAYVQMGAAVPLAELSPHTPEPRRRRPAAAREQLEPVYLPVGDAAHSGGSSFAMNPPACPGEPFRRVCVPSMDRVLPPHAAPGASFKADLELPLNPRDVVKSQEDAINGWLASLVSGCHGQSQIQLQDPYKEPVYVTLAQGNEIA